MPFINISFTEATQCLKNQSFITQLLKQKKINPKEANLLEKLSYKEFDEIQELCEKWFEDKGTEAFQLLSRFVKSQNKRVSWVIFSRSFQSIQYDDRNPLEDYHPRVSEVLTISSKYKIVREEEL